MKRCHYDRWIQVYMYAVMYVDPETMVEENYFTYTKTFVEDYNKMSMPGPLPKYCLGFS